MKESGIGRENGVEAFESCQYHFVRVCMSLTDSFPCDTDSQSKSTIVNIATAEETQATQDWFAMDGEERRYG